MVMHDDEPKEFWILQGSYSGDKHYPEDPFYSAISETEFEGGTHVIVYSEYVKVVKERDEYVHEAEHFQNKCIDLDQANGMLKAELEKLQR